MEQRNLWLKYFLSTYNNELGWIDFEKEMFKKLKIFGIDKGTLFADNIDTVMEQITLDVKRVTNLHR